MIKKQNTYPQLIIVLTAIWSVLFALYLFNIKNCSNENLISSQTLGVFGDFYGGIIGTIVAIIGFYFLYKTYNSQCEQGELILITTLFNNIISDINDIQYKQHKGIEALYKIDNECREPENANSVMNHLMLVLTSFKHIIRITNQSKFLSDDIKQINLDRIYLLYNSKITWPVYNSIYTRLYDDFTLEKNDEITTHEGLGKHTDSELIFQYYEALIFDSYEHLKQRKLILLPNPEHSPKIYEIIKTLYPTD